MHSLHDTHLENRLEIELRAKHLLLASAECFFFFLLKQKFIWFVLFRWLSQLGIKMYICAISLPFHLIQMTLKRNFKLTRFRFGGREARLKINKMKTNTIRIHLNNLLLFDFSYFLPSHPPVLSPTLPLSVLLSLPVSLFFSAQLRFNQINGIYMCIFFHLWNQWMRDWTNTRVHTHTQTHGACSLVFRYFSEYLPHFTYTRMCGVCILNKKTLINLKHFVTSWCIKIWNFEKAKRYSAFRFSLSLQPFLFYFFFSCRFHSAWFFALFFSACPFVRCT